MTKTTLLRDDVPRRVVPLAAIRRSRGEVALVVQYIADLARETNTHSVSVQFLDHLAKEISTGRKPLPAHLIVDGGSNGAE